MFKRLILENWMAIFPLVAFAVIPVGPAINLFGRPIGLQLANVDIGILYVLAIGSLGVYGITLAG